MEHITESLKSGIELLESRKLNFLVEIGVLKNKIEQYEKEISKIEYQIFKTKEIVYALEPNIDL